MVMISSLIVSNWCKLAHPMAIIWQKRVRATQYQVRQAGNTRRLYTNGVCHSQYNPTRPFQGNVWDLLAMPALLVPPKTIKRVLLLGVGGGAVIKQLQRLISPTTIVGVDIDEVHLRVARRFFDVRGRGVRLHHADAVSWLHAYRGKPFDMVIDDLFAERDGQPVRAFKADATWFRTLRDQMTSHGLLVMNFESSRHLRQSAYFESREVGFGFESAYRLSTPQNHNVVAAFLSKDTNVASPRGMLTSGLSSLNAVRRP